MSQTSQAFVRTYACLYSSQIAKKIKSFKDGLLRLHYANSTVLLLDERHRELATTWMASGPLDRSYGFADGQELDFEGYVAQIQGTPISESYTVEDMPGYVAEDEARLPARKRAAKPTGDTFRSAIASDVVAIPSRSQPPPQQLRSPLVSLPRARTPDPIRAPPPIRSAVHSEKIARVRASDPIDYSSL